MGAFNSRECEFADIKVMVLGKELTGLRGIEYKYGREKELLFGQGSDPRSIQRGMKSNEGTLTVLKSDFDAMQAAAKAAGYQDIVDVSGKLINITIVYQKDDGDPMQTVTLINCEFKEWSDGQKSGDKFKEVALPFLYLRKK